MLSKNSIKILSLIIRNPVETYNINQIAKQLKISVGSAHKILTLFKSKNILNSKKRGNAIYYQINFANKEAQKLCELTLLENKAHILSNNTVAKIYADELEKFKAKMVVLFGSILTKKQKANDVDVLFIVDKSAVETVNIFCSSLAKIKTKPIIPLIMTYNDFKKQLIKKNKVLLEIIRTGIILTGEDIFLKLIKENGKN